MISNKKSVYKSCNCRTCKLTSPGTKKFHKWMAHRKFRRGFKLRAKAVDYEFGAISTGYKA